jgi:hypothetical protein
MQPHMLEGLQLHFVRTADQALDIALGKVPVVKKVLPGGPREERPTIGPIH